MMRKDKILFANAKSKTVTTIVENSKLFQLQRMDYFCVSLRCGFCRFDFAEDEEVSIRRCKRVFFFLRKHCGLELKEQRSSEA